MPDVTTTAPNTHLAPYTARGLKGRILSGVQPTGNLHLGNYLGAIRNFARLQGDFECLYCVVAHGAILRIYEKSPLIADQVAVNYRKADITPRQRAMLDFAMKVCLRSHEIDEADFPPLHAHGFSDEDIWDIAAISAFFALSNRMANVTAMRPNDEFYMMGRLPK